MRFLVRILKAIALAMSVFVTYLWMATIFLLIVPLFLFIRMRDPLRLRANRTGGTFWVPRATEMPRLQELTRMS